MSEHTAGSAGREYSQRLGVLAPDQFQAALARFGLGDFVEAAPVSRGLFGQNVFVASTQGDYVLRGMPHYPWQFPKERFGATLLHDRTQVPVAYPYLLDASTDIFGWSYLLMPRLQGVSPADAQLTDAEQVDIARAMGRNLVQMHTLTWPFAGEYDLTSNSIQPFGEGYSQWLVADVRRWLALARGHGAATTADDVIWTEQVIRDAQSALAVDFQPCFVMNDYNPGNVLADRVQGEWHVTGLFDLMEYYFGDGEADLMRLMATYLDWGQHRDMRLAHAFGTAYLASRPARPGFAERYALFMLRDRLIAWEYGTRPGLNWFPEARSFRDYAERYMLSYRLFEPGIT
jgi:hygromycin-B 7''-O-kinase